MHPQRVGRLERLLVPISMHRFFTEEILPNRAVVRGEDVKHLTRVLRLGAGDAVQLCDGQGRECDAVIAAVTPDSVSFDTQPWRESPSEPQHRVTLCQCLPKTGKMETILQKCVELGADAFVPVLSERCVVQPKESFQARISRWQRVSMEAAKQSRRGRIPRVAPLTPLAQLDFSPFDTVLVAYEDEHTVTLKAALHQGVGEKIAVLIGAEGGFSAQEIAALCSRGAVPVSLGARILRTETAGMAMLAQILYEVEP